MQQIFSKPINLFFFKITFAVLKLIIAHSANALTNYFTVIIPFAFYAIRFLTK